MEKIMNSKTKNILVAISAFQVLSNFAINDAQAMEIVNGTVKVGTRQICKLEKFQAFKAIEDIKNNSKYSNNIQVQTDDDLQTILKKLNHQYSDANEILANGLNAQGYYDEYPHKLADYFSSGGCTETNHSEVIGN